MKQINNKKNIINLITILAINFLTFTSTYSQTIKPPSELTKEDVLNLTYDQLLEFSLEELLIIAKNLNVSVDELLNLKTTASSKTQLTTRESPGILTIITSDEIQKSGIRDLIDILRLIPGFSIGYDLDGVIGAGFRGIWAQEGKILILVDGLITNDQLFYSNQLGSHYDINQIKRIEIVRGPGSSIYGGAAELSVINIITKNGQDLNGIETSIINSYFESEFGLTAITAMGGFKHKDLDVSLKAFKSNRKFSEKPFDDNFFRILYQSENITDCHTTSAENINFALTYKKLKINSIYDNYATRVIYDTIFNEKFKSFNTEFKYDFTPIKNLTITPKLSFNKQYPWTSDNSEQYNRITSKYVSGVQFIWDLPKYINTITGFEYQKDKAKYKDIEKDTVYQFFNGKNKIDFDNIIAFIQIYTKTPFINITLGSRYEHHSHYGSSIAPRIGINKIIHNFHFKILYNKSFHTPGFGNLIYNKDLKPEHADISELEAGYKINDNMYLTSNLFYINFKDAIVFWDSISTWGYSNAGKMNTKGIETEFKAMFNKINFTINYSAYSANYTDALSRKLYQVPDKKNLTIGAPNHKITANLIYNLANNLWISPSFIFLNQCYAYTDASYDFQNEIIYPKIGELKPAYILNLTITYKNLLTKGLDFNFSVFDILDREYPLPQGYNGNINPVPMNGRELTFKIRYHLKKEL